MKLLTSSIAETLRRNGLATAATNNDDSLPAHDPAPAVKFFTPDGSATWLITESHPEDPDLLFGLCDLGMGFPELGYVALSELESLRGPLGLPVERDLHFTPEGALSEYSRAARKAQRIVESLPGPDQEQPDPPEPAGAGLS